MFIPCICIHGYIFTIVVCKFHGDNALFSFLCSCVGGFMCCGCFVIVCTSTVLLKHISHSPVLSRCQGPSQIIVLDALSSPKRLEKRPRSATITSQPTERTMPRDITKSRSQSDDGSR